MRTSVLKVLGLTTLAAPALLGLGAPAGAVVAGPTVVAAQASAAPVPNSNIKLNIHGVERYSPKTLAVHYSGTVGCDASHVLYSLTNTLGRTVTPTYNGTPFPAMPPHTMQSWCILGSGTPTTITVGLKGSPKILTLNVT